MLADSYHCPKCDRQLPTSAFHVKQHANRTWISLRCKECAPEHGSAFTTVKGG